jgi:hypothetical protein
MTASDPDSPESPDGPGTSEPQSDGQLQSDGAPKGAAAGSDRSRNQLPDPETRIDWARSLTSGTWTGVRNRSHLAEVDHFLLFVGYPRSGHSLIGSLLNAHPEMVVAHELGVFDYVDHRFGRTALYGLILERDRAFASLGRQWTDYDYTVEGQFQGRFRRLSVVGDKRGRHANISLTRKPELLERLRTTVGVPVRVLHVTRNPYDNIATMAKRSDATIDTAITRFESLCEGAANIRKLLQPDEIMDVNYDQFLGDPRTGLDRMCRFVGLKADQKYLDDCANVVWPAGSQPRQKVEWTDEQIDRVQAIIDRYDGFGEYAFGI